VGVRLSEDEAWERVAAAHTGIVTTLRRDGRPVPLPVWFVVIDRMIYLSTPSKSKKVARIRHDDRASFLVESGSKWVELAAVILQVRVAEVTDQALRTSVRTAMDEKYAAFGMPRSEVPSATTRHYAAPTILRLEPVESPLSWDNARIRLTPTNAAHQDDSKEVSP
jgi:nitroimidazol reductase NimA-like FMN-containing flavoprotein (pyridoxamine 5'-phosphate oxidase superfamily)